MRTDGSAVFNTLSVGLLALTALTLVGYLLILVNPYIFYNPFPPPRSLAGISSTPTPPASPSLPPTWTPTSTFTPAPSPTPRPTRTPTKTPTITPTWPPTATPTPRVTRSPYPFTCDVTYRRPEYDHWSGVAGHIQDLDGNPLPGYYVRVQCPGAPPQTPRAGDNQRYNLIYGNEAAWEAACDPTAYRSLEIRVQLFNDHPDPDGTYRAVSGEVVVHLQGYASGSLGYVVCTLNWEDWR